MLAAAASLAQYAGAYWDLAWHQARGPDTFWTPPHLTIYGGVALALLSGLGAMASARSVSGPGRGRVLLLVTLGPTLQLAAAPLDLVWHRLFGPDVAVASPPHLVGIVGGILGGLGWIVIVAKGPGESGEGPGASRRCLGVTFGGLILGGALLALGELDHDPASQGTFWTPVLVAAIVPGVLGSMSSLSVGRVPAISTTAMYTALRVGAAWILWGLGWPWLGWPLPVLVPALIQGLVPGRSPEGRRSSSSAAGRGMIFGAILAALELARVGLSSGPVPSVPEALARIALTVGAGTVSGLWGHWLACVGDGWLREGASLRGLVMAPEGTGSPAGSTAGKGQGGLECLSRSRASGRRSTSPGRSSSAGRRPSRTRRDGSPRPSGSA